jgi:hypothetical protein
MANGVPFISICVPTYERTQWLPRMLASIEKQAYRDFEVIVTDNSLSDNIKDFLASYTANFHIKYIKNATSMGMARNMHEGAKYAQGSWIKILHDDDFFAHEHALQTIANACQPGVDIVINGYNEYHEGTEKRVDMTLKQAQFSHICQQPDILFANNLIGNPSTLTLHASVTEQFDPMLQWFVDMEYYFRFLGKLKVTYIDQCILEVSHNDTQVTNFTRTNPKVVIPEMLHILHKHGYTVAQSMTAFDGWWRVIRNMGTRTLADVQHYGGSSPIHPLVTHILQYQCKVPASWLKNGLLSKALMYWAYKQLKAQ